MKSLKNKDKKPIQAIAELGGAVPIRPGQGEANEPPEYEDIPAEAYEDVLPKQIPEGGSYTGKKKFTFSSGMGLFTAKPIRWLIRGAIERDSFVGMYGASGSGKSFAAIDLGLCIATGQPWHGHKVKAGKVVYVAGEGKAGIKRRITAWAQRHSNHDQIAENFKLSDSVCLLPDDTESFIDSLREVPDLRLLILDTLQRTYQGDENSTRDMTAYVQAIDEIRAAIPELVIMVVHHTGHTEGRARGSSVLRASLDFEIKVEQRGKHRIIEHTKAKESELFKPMAFELKTEILEGWKGEEGEPVTSATLHHDPDFDCTKAKAGKVAKGKNPKAAMVVLHSLIDAQRRNLELNDHDPADAKVLTSDWIESCRGNPEIHSRCLAPSEFFRRISSVLVDQGIVTLEGEYVRLSE
ncbi:MAG: AAA family ATPase [Thiolinea sp.]